MRQGYFGPPDLPEARRRRRPGRGRGGRRFDTEQLLRELPSVDPELRRLFTKWTDAKLRSLEATGNGEAATGNGQTATAERPLSLRERAPSAPPVRKPPRPRREREAAPPVEAAAPGPAAATAEAAPLAGATPAVDAPRAELAPAPEAAPAAPAKRSRVRGGIALGVALLFYAAATVVAALVAEDQGGGDGRAAAVAGPAEVTVADDWARAAPVVPGFGGPGAASFSPPGEGSGSSLTLGSVEPSATSMLPGALLRELAGPAPRPTIRERPDAWVFTYAGMRLDDRPGRLTVHLIATDRGTAGVACLNGAASCDEAAATLRPAPGATAHRGLSSEYAAALDRAIADLSESRTAARASLSAAPTVAPARARALALDVERAYGLAARRHGALAALRERPELAAANDRITTALERAGRAYGALAAAAGSADAGSLAASRRTILQREEDLREALRGLAGLGYRPKPVE